MIMKTGGGMILKSDTAARVDKIARLRSGIETVGCGIRCVARIRVSPKIHAERALATGQDRQQKAQDAKPAGFLFCHVYFIGPLYARSVRIMPFEKTDSKKQSRGRQK
jgi:hypothetical protein